MKKNIIGLAAACLFITHNSPAVSLDDIQFWIGTGTNRAALVVEWSTPETFVGAFASSTVPAPIANKTLVWGYRFNGPASGANMLKAVLAADPTFYSVVSLTYGTYVEGLGYRLSGTGLSGIKDSTHTNYFTNRFLTNATVDVDAAGPVLGGDMYWGGYFGPNWELWVEAGGAGGFTNAPDRGTNTYWTSTDPTFASTGFHGEWDLAQTGLDGMTLSNGSWVGFSVAAGPYHYDLDAPYNAHKRAPALPDAGFTAPPVQNLSGRFSGGQWQAQFLSRSNWLYTLERSSDLKNWSATAPAVSGNGTNVIATDAAPPADKSFYRLHAERP